MFIIDAKKRRDLTHDKISIFVTDNYNFIIKIIHGTNVFH